NRIENNGHNGVVFRVDQIRGGNDTVLRGNTIRQNMQSSAAGSEGPVTAAEVHVKNGLKHVLIEGNTIEPRAGIPAIHIESGCEDVHVINSKVASGQVDQPAAPSVQPTANWCVALLQRVGPAALPLDGATHLGIDEL